MILVSDYEYTLFKELKLKHNRSIIIDRESMIVAWNSREQLK